MPVTLRPLLVGVVPGREKCKISQNYYGDAIRCQENSRCAWIIIPPGLGGGGITVGNSDSLVGGADGSDVLVDGRDDG